MLTFDFISSVFDMITFAALWWGFGGEAELFRTGWFIESLATQVLLIFVICVRGRPWSSLPHPLLAASSLAAVLLAAALPLLPIGHWLGFVAPPSELIATVAGLAVLYRVAVEAVKRRFYARVSVHHS